MISIAFGGVCSDKTIIHVHLTTSQYRVALQLIYKIKLEFKAYFAIG